MRHADVVLDHHLLYIGMTSIAWQNGGPVFRSGAVGTGQGCCCQKPCNCPQAYSQCPATVPFSLRCDGNAPGNCSGGGIAGPVWYASGAFDFVDFNGFPFGRQNTASLRCIKDPDRWVVWAVQQVYYAGNSWFKDWHGFVDCDADGWPAAGQATLQEGPPPGQAETPSTPWPRPVDFLTITVTITRP